MHIQETHHASTILCWFGVRQVPHMLTLSLFPWPILHKQKQPVCLCQSPRRKKEWNGNGRSPPPRPSALSVSILYPSFHNVGQRRHCVSIPALILAKTDQLPQCNEQMATDALSIVPYPVTPRAPDIPPVHIGISVTFDIRQLFLTSLRWLLF